MYLHNARNHWAITNPQDGKAGYGPNGPTYIRLHCYCSRMCQMLSANVHSVTCHALVHFHSLCPLVDEPMSIYHELENCDHFWFS